MTSLVITNWDRFQHYKDRDPPWVKLYRDLLTSESWVLGTDLSRVIQVASVVLAPRYSNRIPLNFRLLKQVMALDCKEAEFLAAIKHLEACKFLEIQQDEDECKQDASSALACCASEKSREEKIRTDKNAPPAAVAGLDLVSWERWVKYRSEIRKPIKPASMESAQKALAAFKSEQGAVVERSIANGWQGLFPLNTNGKAAAPQNDKAGEAWAYLVSNDGKRMDAASEQALQAVGGWLAIKGRNNFNEAKLRAEFCDAYRRAA